MTRKKRESKAELYPGRVYTRFKVLLAEKEIKDGRKYTYNDINKMTNIATSTLSAYAQNKKTVKAFKKSTLARLCIFFDCDLGELLIYDRDLK